MAKYVGVFRLDDAAAIGIDDGPGVLLTISGFWSVEGVVLQRTEGLSRHDCPHVVTQVAISTIGALVDSDGLNLGQQGGWGIGVVAHLFYIFGCGLASLGFHLF